MDDDTRECWRRYLNAKANISATADHDAEYVASALREDDLREAQLLEHLGGVDAARAYIQAPGSIDQLTELAASVHIGPGTLDWALKPMYAPGAADGLSSTR